jgi:hypothetical protein
MLSRILSASSESLHYVELKPEAPYEIPETEPKDWPSAGEVKFV